MPPAGARNESHFDAGLFPARLFFLEEMALLSGRLDNNKDRLPLAFEVKSTATIPEIGVVGNIVMYAVVATCGLVAWLFIHMAFGGLLIPNYLSKHFC